MIKSIHLKLLLAFLLNQLLSESLSANESVVAQLAQIEDLGRKDLVEMRRNLAVISSRYKEFAAEEACYFDFLEISSLGDNFQPSQVMQMLSQFISTCRDEYSLIRGKTLLAHVSALAGEYDTAVIEINQALALVKDIDDARLKSQIHWMAASVFMSLEQYELSMQYADQLLREAYDDISVCFGGVNKYRVMLREKQPVDVEQMNDYIKICRDSDLWVQVFKLRLDWIYYFALPNQNQTELDQLLQDMIQIKMELAQIQPQMIQIHVDLAQIQHRDLHVYYAAVLAQIYLAQKEYAAAELSAQVAIDQADKVFDVEELLLALDVMVAVNRVRDNDAKAYLFLSQKTELERKIYDARMAKQVAFFQQKHRNLSHESEIEELNQNNELLELENRLVLETNKKQKLSVVLISLLLAALAMWGYRLKKQHDRVKSISEIDHLTQVFSRKAFEEQMITTVKQCRLNRSQLHLAIFDLDHFKSVNDRFGHLVGDWVLQQVIIACEEVIDEDALVARLGGEEFVIVTPNISQRDATKLFEKMRDAIERMDCSETGHDFRVTASFGVSSSLHSGFELSALLKDADKALFQAKENGRNQIRVSQSV